MAEETVVEEKPVAAAQLAGLDSAAQPQTGEQRTFSQAEVDRIVKERLEREKSARDKATARAREEAEAQALKNNQEWQTLAERSALRVSELVARVGELEPLGEQVARYKGALENSLLAEKRDLPRHVLVLLEMLGPIEQIEYLAAHRAEFGRGRLDGVPASPSPKQRALSEEEQDAARRGQSALYSNF